MQTVFHDGAGLLDTAALSHSAEVTSTEVMLAVVRGNLVPVGRRRGVAGYPALLFAQSAATDLRLTLRNQVSKSRATAELGWMPCTIKALQYRGLMEEGGPKSLDLAVLARFRTVPCFGQGGTPLVFQTSGHALGAAFSIKAAMRRADRHRDEHHGLLDPD